MKHFLSFAALLVAAALPARAQDAGAFARLGFDARGMALGGGLAADVFSGASPFYNPALAPRLDGQSLDATAAFLSLDRELQSIQFTTPLEPRAGIGAGLLRAAVSNIDGRDGSGYATQEYETSETAVWLAFGLRLSRKTSLGAGLRFYRNDLLDGVTPALALGVNVGLATQLSDRLALALVADDLFARYDWDTSEAFDGGKRTSDTFPLRVRLASAYRLGERGVLTGEVEARSRSVEVRRRDVFVFDGVPQETVTSEKLREVSLYARFGAEYWLAEPFGVRAGVDRLGAGSFEEALPAAGFAVRQRLGELAGRLDYTARLEPFAYGVAHVVSLHLDL